MSAKRMIGLHMTAGDEETRRLAEGVLRYASDHPELTVGDFCYPDDIPDLTNSPPWAGKADGMVVAVHRLPGIVPWLRRGRAPVVAIGSDLRKDMFTVGTNPRSITRLAVEHFRKLGLRHFAYVGHRPTDGSHDRARVLAQELAKHQLELQCCHTERLLSGTYKDFTSLDEVEPELVGLIRDAEKPLAVVAINDRFAAGVCHIVQALGLAIPADVAVLGVRDLEIARLSTPPISSVRPDHEGMGYEAARLVHRLMRGERPARRSVQLSPLELVERESTIGKQRAAITDIDRALEFIRKNACAGIRVDHVADHIRVPRRTFEIEFAAVTGHTAGEEIRNVRLERAKVLLETTDLPLARVADMVGLNAASYLSEFFRRWARMTPGEYRRQQRP